MRLNLGCGHDRQDGYLNVDAFPSEATDFIWDLERTPWPWESDSVEAVLLIHTLEHIGQDTKTFLAIMGELYRVCCDGASVHIRVPHPRHDHFLCDPTHVRAITPTTLMQFDREKNEEWVRARNSNSKLALQTGVDFVIKDVQIVLDDPYAAMFLEKRIPEAELDQIIRERNNIAKEFQITLRVRKDD